MERTHSELGFQGRCRSGKAGFRQDLRRTGVPVVRAVVGATRFRQALLLAITVVVGPQFAMAQPETEPGAPPLIIRGSSSALEPAGPGSGGSGLVLRGTQPPVQPPAPIYACAPGYLPDPSLGCVIPGLAYAPSDLDYWPSDWPYEFSRVRRHRFARARPPGRIGQHVARFGRR